MTFKELMIKAAEEGLLEISTEGSMDFASPVGRAAAAAATLDEEEAPEPAEEAPAPMFQGEVRLEYLEPEDQRRLIEFIDDLEEHSRFLTVTFLVDRISHSSVVPMLSESQVKGLVLKAIDSGVFEVHQTDTISKATGLPFTRRELALNEEHPLVQQVLGLD